MAIFKISISSLTHLTEYKDANEKYLSVIGSM